MHFFDATHRSINTLPENANGTETVKVVGPAASCVVGQPEVQHPPTVHVSSLHDHDANMN